MLEPTDEGHYTVYLPSYDDDHLISHLGKFENIHWQVFSKHNKNDIVEKGIEIHPISNDSFLKSMASSTGVLCGAGFETPAEAMFLGKKLLVIPMENQYEQQCNAAALKTIGVPVIKKLKKEYYGKIKDWLDSDYKIEITYPDCTEKIINKIFENYVNKILKKNTWDKRYSLTYFDKENKKQPKDHSKSSVKNKIVTIHG